MTLSTDASPPITSRSSSQHRRRRLLAPSVAATAACVLALIAATGTSRAADVRARSIGQTVYVPVWPNVFHGPGVAKLQLAATLQVHNADPERPIELLSVEYYHFDGSKLRSFLGKEAPLTLKPFAARAYHITEAETKGEAGANFLVKWRSAEPVNVPIIDAVMIGVEHGQGISFLSHGQPISEP